MAGKRTPWVWILLVAMLGLPRPGAAQDEETGWSDEAEITFVLTGGNASASTFGFKNTLERAWERRAFKLSLGGIRTESGITTRTATGTPDDFTVSETTEDRLTAESYFVKGRVDQDLGTTGLLFAGADWDRNTFAGIQNRYTLVSGAGRTWFEEETRMLETDLGLTYTFQDDVMEDPEADDSFLGLRASYDLSHQLSETADFGSVLALDQNLNDTEDLRADWTNSISVAMSERLALKTSFQVLFDNQPALTAVPLGDEEVLTPLNKTDTVFTVAVVANF